MRILFISQEYPPETGWGGIGSYVASMAPALAARGHEVHVLSCVGGQLSRDYLDQDVHIHRRGVFHVRGMSRLRVLVVGITGTPGTWDRLQLGLSTFLERRRLGGRFDVVEYPDWMAEGWLFALRRSTPAVAHLHTPAPIIARHTRLPITRDDRWTSALEKYAVGRADVITSPSQLLVDCLRNDGWLNGSGADVIPYALDWPRWTDAGPVSATGPVILSVGRIERRKSPETVVEAVSLIRNRLPNAQAVFVGRSSGMREGLPYVDWLLKNFNGSDGCQFVGLLPRPEISKLFSKARVLAMPSTFDNYPLAAMEAMAAGRPVVVGAETGVAELIRRTGAGSVVPSEDPRALADALLPYLQDARYAERVGECARAAIRKFHDPDTVAQQREAVYQKAATVHSLRKHA